MAARRRLSVHYPPRPSLEQTLSSKANLAGARRFFAGEGALIFADGKAGMARTAGDVWLRPSAYRQMSTYLDLNEHAAVAGLRLTWNDASHPSLLDTPLFDDLRTVLSDNRHRRLGEKNIEVQCVEDGDQPWDLTATLVYDHHTILAGGERLLDEGRVAVYARRRDDNAVDIAFVMHRSEDLEVVRQWLRAADSDGRWLPRPAGLPRENPNRQEALERLLSTIRSGGLRAVSHPEIHRGTGTPRADTAFVSVFKRAAYETEMTNVETVVERMEADGGIISGLTIYTHISGQKPVVSARIRQRPKDDHLRLIWQPSRTLDSDQMPDLTESVWDNLNVIEWSEGQKRDCLLSMWVEAIDAIEPRDAAKQLLAAGA
jgi:hypothetical protein